MILINQYLYMYMYGYVINILFYTLLYYCPDFEIFNLFMLLKTYIVKKFTEMYIYIYIYIYINRIYTYINILNFSVRVPLSPRKYGKLFILDIS